MAIIFNVDQEIESIFINIKYDCEIWQNILFSGYYGFEQLIITYFYSCVFLFVYYWYLSSLLYDADIYICLKSYY